MDLVTIVAAATPFEKITGAFQNISTLITDVINAITDNPILVIFMACGFLGIGLRMFRSLKSTAKAN